MSLLGGDVAIIGMSCIFPGASNIQTYWQNILSKVDAISTFPKGCDSDDVFNQNSTIDDRIYSRQGGYLGDLAQFNPLEYGITAQSVDGGDPDQFLALRVAHEALSDAGYVGRSIDRKRIMVVIGSGTSINRGSVNILQHSLIIDQTLNILKQLQPEYSQEKLQKIRQELKASLPPFNDEIALDLLPNGVAGRLADRLDIRGPSYTVDAGCASSLIAVENGIQGLLAQKCDLAIAGGVQAFIPPPILMLFTQLNVLSQKGQICPFDQDADGTLLGEGIGMVILKRLNDAERDGDRVYAVIKGIGTSSDGRLQDIVTSRVEGEYLALRLIYDATGLSPRTVGLIEAHGTGIPVGDASEIQALSQVFGSRDGVYPWCAVGSVKSMIGHLIPAAGIAGLIKATLALYHKVLPPTRNCDKPNPRLHLGKTPFYINTETRPWTHGRPEPRRAGVNTFGFGGINAHAILEEYTGQNGYEFHNFIHGWDTEIFIIQGESRQEMIKAAKRLLQFISSGPVLELKDIAYTLNCPLDESGYRLAIVANSLKTLEEKLVHSLKHLTNPDCNRIKDKSGIFFFEEPLRREGTLAFLFPGEGSQYVNMLADLCLHFPDVRACFDRIDRAFFNNNRDVVPSQLLFPPPRVPSAKGNSSEHALWQMDFAVAAVFIANHALFTLLNRMEIRPDAVVGHSSGEFAALMASGAVDIRSEEQVIQLALELIRVHESLGEQIPDARLVAVGVANSSVVNSVVVESAGALHVAMDNCPHQVVLCGSEAAVASGINRLQSQGAICNLLPFNRAYHTPLFKPVCDQFSSFFQRLKIVSPCIPIYSCATAQSHQDDPEEIRQLAVEQWCRKVRFHETINAMHDDGVRIFVEVGPRGNLTSFVDDILRNRCYLAVPSNVHHRSGITQINYMTGLLAAHGVHMKLDYLYKHRAPKKLSFEALRGQSEKCRENTGSVRLVRELPVLRLRHSSKNDISEGQPSASGAFLALKDLKSPVQKRATLQDDGSCHHGGHEVQPSSEKDKPDRASLSSSVANSIPSTQMVQNTNLRCQDISRSKVMQNYLQTMERFLTIQQEIMAVFRAGAGNATCDTMFSVSWPQPIAHLPASLGFQCCYFSGMGDKAWFQILPYIVLNRRELETWLYLSGTEKRRREWLFGRMVAKDAVRLFLKDQYGVKAFPADIEIIKDEHGRPIVAGELIEKLGCRLSLSITHSGERVVAVAGERGDHLGVGIDMEQVIQRHEGLERLVLSAKEQDILSVIPIPKREEWLLRLWCAKEAVAKGLGRGMMGGPSNLVVQELKEENGRVLLMLSGDLARQMPSYADMVFTAYTQCEEGFVFAVSPV